MFRPLLALTIALTCLSGAHGQTSRPTTSRPTTRATPDSTIDIRSLLVRSPTARGTGTVVNIDPLVGTLVEGTFQTPRPDKDWQWLTSTDPTFEDPRLSGGWAYTEVESDADRVMLLRAAGHVMVYVNGQPRVGDVYSGGYVALPIALKKGTNTLLFQGGRGRLSARLAPVPADARYAILTDDPTLPDIVESQPGLMFAGVVVANLTDQPVKPEFKVELQGDAGLFKPPEGSTPPAPPPGAATGSVAMLTGSDVVPPMSVRKLTLTFIAGNQGKAGGEAWLSVTDNTAPDNTALQARFKLRVRKVTDSRRITFRSSIDGSTQYYAVVPATDAPLPAHSPSPATPPPQAPGSTTATLPPATLPPAMLPSAMLPPRGPTARLDSTAPGTLFDKLTVPALTPSDPQAAPGRPAIVLSLHGASVEAQSQAEAYGQKSWAHIVCPTNRRPFGFDWEDWGRLDALEVLDHAKATLPHDPTRVYLTGHSMGGHGTWHLAVTTPDLFAAAAPSAGWISFATYAQSKAATQPTAPSPVTAFRQASAASDTLSLKSNLATLGLFILHGDADDNVPVTEARKMAEALTPFHRDWTLLEQKGAGHWWSEGSEPGARCVDHPRIFDLFSRRMLPPLADVPSVNFITTNPALSSRFAWARIEQQDRSGEPSRLSLSVSPLTHTFTGTTENVRRLTLALPMMKWTASTGDVTLSIDNTQLKIQPTSQSITIQKTDGQWQPAALQPYPSKSAERAGPLKLALQNRMTFVYGTIGTPTENALSYQKARYDAEVWYYRGNGSVPVVPDTDPSLAQDRNTTLVLYGNADTNAAFAHLEPGCPINVTRQQIKLTPPATPSTPAQIRNPKSEIPNPPSPLDFPGDHTALFCYPRSGSPTAMIIAIAPTSERAARASMRLPLFASGIAWPDYAILSADAYTVGAPAIKSAGFFTQSWQLP